MCGAPTPRCPSTIVPLAPEVQDSKEAAAELRHDDQQAALQQQHQHPSVRDCVPHVLVLRTLRRTIQRQTAPHPPCLLCLYCMEIWTRLSPLFFISPVHESTRCREDDQSRGAPRPLPVAGKQICGCMRCAACCTWIGRGLPDPFCHHSFIASIVRST